MEDRMNFSPPPHTFILSPGVWEGSGIISFSMADDVLHFKTRWTVLPQEEGKIYFSQLLDVNEYTDKMQNSFCISDLSQDKFHIQLENQLAGKVQGEGLISPQSIAWEFRRKDQEFEGFEIYERQEEGTYKMRAEFTAGEGLRTFVKGFIEKI